MPCTPTAGLSHSYISQWATLTMLHQSPRDAPSLDPIPSPARGRVRARKSEQSDADDECQTPRAFRRSTHSPRPAPLAPVSSRGSLANFRPRATRLTARAAPLPNPTMHFRRLAHRPPVDTRLANEDRTPSDLTNRVVSRERAATTPSPDLIFNMSPVLGYDGPARPYRVASCLSGELDVAGECEIEVPVTHVEELHITEPKSVRDTAFLYPYTPALPEPEAQYESSTAFSTSRETSDREEDSSTSTTSALVDDLVSPAGACLIERPAIPRLGRMHAKSDPLPTRLSSASTTSASCRAQPIPIPKPSPRVPSDYGGVNSSLAHSVSVPAPQWAKAPASTARLARRVRRAETEKSAARAEAEDVTDEWCGTADAVPTTTAPVPVTRRRKDQQPSVPARKKRFFIAGAGEIGESYDGDMDSEFSSWQ
ncbi:hypothetical protein FRC07_004452 [Ceratobasidium sp. 392]|nr:hypothetical protein FRC07_004452 [Ceratobasidium sp. 392]